MKLMEPTQFVFHPKTFFFDPLSKPTEFAASISRLAVKRTQPSEVGLTPDGNKLHTQLIQPL
ncbi:hypothetical protein HanRHA438_Chr01g0036921 [Helianthus annuus]|nr:hypothetical protein HanRHA438_Chr01g0036921 [Helianthus annuus]